MAVFTFPGQIIPIQAMKEIHIEKCTETVKENCFTEPLNAVFPPDDLVTHLRCTNGLQTRTAIAAAAQILYQADCDLRFIQEPTLRVQIILQKLRVSSLHAQ